MNLLPLERSETLQELGMTEAAAENPFLEQLAECEKRFMQQAAPRYTYCILPLIRTESVLYADTILLEGNAIRQHLEGCDRIVLLAATLGSMVDLLIDRAQKHNLANATILEALADTALKQICDRAKLQIQETMPDSFFTACFFPGNGDFPHNVQFQLLSHLNVARQLGILITETHAIIPRKSICTLFGLLEAR